MTAPVFTVGYQGASLAALIEALRAAGVATVLDVRAIPFSRRPEFRQAALAKAVEVAGLGYAHLVRLGNPQDARAAAKAGDAATYRRLFAAHLDGAEGKAGLDEAARVAAGGAPVCLLCLEADPRDCHRSAVAERLAARLGAAVEHLRPQAAARAPDLFG